MAPEGLQAQYVINVIRSRKNFQKVYVRLHICDVRQNLPLLFRSEYPFVLHHGDLLENNFHVEPESGHITGVVDWAEAQIAPYGISLGALEIVVGVQMSRDWFFPTFS